MLFIEISFPFVWRRLASGCDCSLTQSFLLITIFCSIAQLNFFHRFLSFYLIVFLVFSLDLTSKWEKMMEIERKWKKFCMNLIQIARKLHQLFKESHCYKYKEILLQPFEPVRSVFGYYLLAYPLWNCWHIVKPFQHRFYIQARTSAQNQNVMFFKESVN